MRILTSSILLVCTLKASDAKWELASAHRQWAAPHAFNLTEPHKLLPIRLRLALQFETDDRISRIYEVKPGEEFDWKFESADGLVL